MNLGDNSEVNVHTLSNEQIKQLAKEMWKPVYYAAFVILMIQISRWAFQLGKDDSDPEGRGRSGFTILTDHKTGQQYLSDGKGGLVKRDSR